MSLLFILIPEVPAFLPFCFLPLDFLPLDFLPLDFLPLCFLLDFLSLVFLPFDFLLPGFFHPDSFYSLVWQPFRRGGSN